jgi:hypothetical protein
MTVARVQNHKGVPTLFIDGVPHPAYVYFFPVPVKEHIADFAEAGVHIYTWGWSDIIAHSMDMGWAGPDTYDYARLDQEVNAILDADPDAYLIPRIAVSAPEWWLEAHPDDRILFDNGSDWSVSSRGFETSLASQVWLKEASAAFEHFVRHVQSMPYGGRFIGYQLTGGYNEWFYTFSPDFPDYSPAATQAFRAWLRARYAGDVAALRASWKDESVDFETAAVPTRARRMKTDLNLLRDPSVSRYVSDYYQFFSEVDAAALIHFCEVGKRATGGESILGAFYGYLMNATGGYAGGYSVWHWGHQALRQVLESPYIDYLCAPYQYCYRGPGGYDGPQGVSESVKLHGKLWLTECDHPTFVALPDHWGVGGRPVPSRAQSLALLKRDFAQRLIRRVGMWWMDLVPKGGWYHHPDIVRFMQRTVKLLERSAGLDMHYKGEVAVIIDEETPYYLKPGSELLYPLVFVQDRLGFSRMGTPYDIYLHNDLADPNMPEYKLYIFVNTLYLTEEERDTIKARVQGEGKVVLWMYAPGFIGKDGLSVEHMRDLSGMDIGCRQSRFRANGCPIRLYLTDFDHPITRGVPSNTIFGVDEPIGPIFYCQDPDATVLGRLLPPHANAREVGEFPGFVVKQFEDWTSVFCAVPGIPSHLLRNIARFAGCHVYSDDDDVIYANSHFLAIHTNNGGRKRIRLPVPSDVYDAFTEELVARGVSEFTDDLPQYGTRLYFLGDVSEIAGPDSLPGS